MEELVLASGSPRRSELLRRAGIAFTVCVTDANENLPAGIPAGSAAAFLACRKAKSALKAYSERRILAADTVVLLGGEALGKPADAEDAAQMLRCLSGAVHEVATGVCVRQGRRAYVFTERTRVEFYPLTEAEIRAYVATGEPLDKAGAYGIQGLGGQLVKGICGSYDNVVGLPVARVVRVLKELERIWV